MAERRAGGLAQHRVGPEAEAAGERIGVGADARERRQHLDVARIAAAQHDVLGRQRGGEPRDDILDAFAPLALAVAYERLFADVILERRPAVRQVREFHRHQRAVDDERGAEPGAEAQEQHLAALIAAERLHRRIVDHPHRTSRTRPRSRNSPSRVPGYAARRRACGARPGPDSRSPPRRMSSRAPAPARRRPSVPPSASGRTPSGARPGGRWP